MSRCTESSHLYKYTYDWQGFRCKKDDGVRVTKYYYDGNKLLGEYVNTIGGARTWYYYDESGICGMRYNDTDYAFVKNPLGDVIAIIQSGKVVAKYEYDAWGNHKVFNPNGTVNTNTSFIGNINPIRYRATGCAHPGNEKADAGAPLARASAHIYHALQGVRSYARSRFCMGGSRCR